MMVDVKENTLAFAVDEATRRLACAEHFSGASLVNMPLRYPSGASVVVEIMEPILDHCTITDMGFGFQEAELIGATRQFENIAENLSSPSSVLYNDRSFFLTNIPRSRLPAAMIAVANSSQRAASTTSAKIAEQTAQGQRANAKSHPRCSG
jgi:hypothetical protein